jgi:two-component system, NarL family, sensor histidine kinase UhpB
MELSALPLHGHAAQASRERVAAMLEALDHTVASVRRIATELRPLMLDDLGLGAAIDWLAHDVSRRLGLQLQLDIEEPPPAPAPDERSAIALYRLAQDILEHVARAGSINRLKVSLAQRADELVMAFRCDSPPHRVGHARAPASALQPGQPLQHRARQLGARLEVTHTSDAAMTIVARMPLPRATAGDRPPERRLRSDDRRRRLVP